MTPEQQRKVDLVKQLMTNAVEEMRQNCDWFEYVVMSRAIWWTLPLTGDFPTRRWWFILREIR